MLIEKMINQLGMPTGVSTLFYMLIVLLAFHLGLHSTFGTLG